MPLHPQETPPPACQAAAGELSAVAKATGLAGRCFLFRGPLPLLTAAAPLPQVSQPSRLSGGLPLWQPQQQHSSSSLHTAQPAASTMRCRASKPGASGSSDGGDAAPSFLLSAVPLALWAGLMGYVFFLAPNQTPNIDSFVVQKLVGCDVWRDAARLAG